MATQGTVFTQSMKAAADYTADANLGLLLKIDTAAPEQAILLTTAGARVDGILMNKPRRGEACEMVTTGYGKALCGAVIATAGIELAADATGRLVPAVSGNYVFAISRTTTAAAGEWVGLSIDKYIKP